MSSPPASSQSSQSSSARVPFALSRSQPRLSTPIRAPRGPASLQNSPDTPASPGFSPLSLRSYPSSAFTTPASAIDTSKMSFAQRLANAGIDSPASPSDSKVAVFNVADNTGNWRARGALKGSFSDDSSFGDDEGMPWFFGSGVEPTLNFFPSRLGSEFVHSRDSSSMHNKENVLLPAPFLSTHRRAHLNPRSPLTAKSNTGTSSVSAYATSTVATPPPKECTVSQLKMKGSLTEPAQPRRRSVLGQQQQNQLFNIQEDYNVYTPFNMSPVHMRTQDQSRHLPPHFATLPSTPLPQPSFALPRILSPSPEPTTIAAHNETFETVAADESNVVSTADDHANQSDASDNGCAVCGITSGSLATLIPCSHPICPACLTSALNIVGEKDMSCSTCHAHVEDFRLSSGAPDKRRTSAKTEQSVGFAGLNPFSTLSSNVDVVPKASSANSRYDAFSKSEHLAVLRIDNVPWDITPPSLIAWFAPHPITRAHILLDLKGKTLSHAFVELPSSAVRAALRSVHNKILGRGRRARGVTVTVSSQGELMKELFPSWRGQWEGETGRPRVGGMVHERVLMALECGLLSTSEVEALVQLVRQPDSHFVKDPSLPFYSLTNLLYKFPADIDSRIFWSTNLRDNIFELTCTAVQSLAGRLNEDERLQRKGINPDVLAQLLEAGVACEAFTMHQRSQLAALRNPSSDGSASVPSSPPSQSPAPSSSVSPSTPANATSTNESLIALQMQMAQLQIQNYLQQQQHQQYAPQHTPVNVPVPHLPSMPMNVREEAPSPFSILAQEFGVEPHVVQALAQRLSNMC